MVMNDPADVPTMDGRLRRCAVPMRRTAAAQAAANGGMGGSDAAWPGIGPLSLGCDNGTPIRPSVEREVS